LYNRYVHISVRAFAGCREAIGARALRLDVAADSTVAQAWDALRARYPRLDTLPYPVAFAVNDEYRQRVRAIIRKTTVTIAKTRSAMPIAPLRAHAFTVRGRG